MTASGLDNLVQDVTEWFRNRGATVLTAQVQMGGIEFCAPPHHKAEQSKNAHNRYLYISEDLAPYAGPGTTVVPPVLWEEGLRRVTEGASDIFVRSIRRVPAEYDFATGSWLPEHIRVRLAVVTDMKSTTPLDSL